MYRMSLERTLTSISLLQVVEWHKLITWNMLTCYWLKESVYAIKHTAESTCRYNFSQWITCICISTHYFNKIVRNAIKDWHLKSKRWNDLSAHKLKYNFNYLRFIISTIPIKAYSVNRCSTCGSIGIHQETWKNISKFHFTNIRSIRTKS